MIDLTTYALLRKQISSVASGISDVRAEGDELVFVLVDGREVRVAIPATEIRDAVVRDDILVLTLEDDKEVVVDATLTQSGQAADAKVTGDVVSQLKDEIEELKGSHLTEIGATPLRVERDTPGVILRSDGECAYTIKSDTVINTDTMTFVEKDITLTHDSFYELAPAATVTQWYNGYATVYISGLTIGEEYSLVIDCRNVAFDSANYISGGYYRLFKGTAAAETEKQFAVTQEGLSVTNFTAVAETQWLRIWVYDGIKYDVTKSIASDTRVSMKEQELQFKNRKL